MVSKAKPDGMLVPAVSSTMLAYCLSPYTSKITPTRITAPPYIKKCSSPPFNSCFSVSCWCLSPRGSECFSNDLQMRRRESSINMHTVKVTSRHARTHLHTHTHACTHLAIPRDNWVIGGEPPSQHPVTIKASAMSVKLHEVKAHSARV